MRSQFVAYDNQHSHSSLGSFHAANRMLDPVPRSQDWVTPLGEGRGLETLLALLPTMFIPFWNSTDPTMIQQVQVGTLDLCWFSLQSLDSYRPDLGQGIRPLETSPGAPLQNEGSVLLTGPRPVGNFSPGSKATQTGLISRGQHAGSIAGRCNRTH
ncbi:MAG: hypothetical protein OSA98_21955 [Rubripirellula sp.]|nr:hypothetical protein [Rubripirellula sp.]